MPNTASMKEHRLRTGEVELYWVEDGDPARPAILFLHGFPDCHRVWSHQLEALRDEFHVIAFDMRGAGESTPPSESDGYRVEKLLPDIAAIIDAAVGPQGRVHLVGHDWGSVIGWFFVQHPQYRKRVLSWTSMSGPHLGMLWSWVARKFRSARPREIRKALGQLSHSWYIFAMQIPGGGRYVFGRHGRRVWPQALRGGGVPKNDPYLRLSSDEIRDITLYPLKLYQQNALRSIPAPQPGSITVPTQLIVPLRDNFIRPEVFEYLDEYVPDLTRVELDANHWAQRSHPEEINRLVRGFVSRH